MQDDELMSIIKYNLWYMKNKEKDPNLKYDPKEWGIEIYEEEVTK